MNSKVLEERWERVEGFPEYLISNFGELMREDSGRILKTRIQKRSGRRQVSIYYAPGLRSTVYIHRLVAQAFIKGYDPEKVILHINEDPLDNCALNLRVGRKRKRMGEFY